MARILGSKLCDVISPPRVFLIIATVDTVATMLLPLATNWMWLLCYCIVNGLTDGLMAIANILSILQILTQKQKAQGFGFHQLCISTALLCGPPIGGEPQRWNTLLPTSSKIRYGQKSIKWSIQSCDVACCLSSFINQRITSPQVAYFRVFPLAFSLRFRNQELDYFRESFLSAWTTAFG